MACQEFDIDVQVSADYRRFKALPRACCPQPFFRARKRKREEAATSNRLSSETLPAEQARLLQSLAKDAQQRPEHENCTECCVKRNHASPPVSEEFMSGRSTEEALAGGFLLPESTSWLQDDIFSSPDGLRSAGLVPPGGFAAAVVDPPWQSKSRGVRYQKCQSDELPQLRLGELLAPGGLCALWVTNDPKKQAFVSEKLFPEWGLREVACWIWIKVTNDGEPVLPFGADRPRLPFEKVLVARRPLEENDGVQDPTDRIFTAVPGAHSQKPFLDDFLPAGPKLEVFARNLRPGWTSWGRKQDSSKKERPRDDTPDVAEYLMQCVCSDQLNIQLKGVLCIKHIAMEDVTFQNYLLACPGALKILEDIAAPPIVPQARAIEPQEVRTVRDATKTALEAIRTPHSVEKSTAGASLKARCQAASEEEFVDSGWNRVKGQAFFDLRAAEQRFAELDGGQHASMIIGPGGSTIRYYGTRGEVQLQMEEHWEEHFKGARGLEALNKARKGTEVKEVKELASRASQMECTLPGQVQEALGQATGKQLMYMCAKGHGLRVQARRGAVCDVCHQKGTAYSCSAGCNWDACKRCATIPNQADAGKQLQEADPARARAEANREEAAAAAEAKRKEAEAAAAEARRQEEIDASKADGGKQLALTCPKGHCLQKQRIRKRLCDVCRMNNPDYQCSVGCAWGACLSCVKEADRVAAERAWAEANPEEAAAAAEAKRQEAEAAAAEARRREEIEANVPGELSRHFLGGYFHGELLTSKQYQDDHFDEVASYRYDSELKASPASLAPGEEPPPTHGPIHVWRHAVDLRTNGELQDIMVLYHYTGMTGFMNVASLEQSMAELRASLVDERAHFGFGIYASQHEPAVWGSRMRIVLNNFSNASPFSDLNGAEAELRNREWGDGRGNDHRGMYCIPILVNRSMAYNIFQRQTPEFAAKTVEEGGQRRQIRLGEDYKGRPVDRERDVWVLRVTDDRGEVCNGTADSDLVLDILRAHIKRDNRNFVAKWYYQSELAQVFQAQGNWRLAKECQACEAHNAVTHREMRVRTCAVVALRVAVEIATAKLDRVLSNDRDGDAVCEKLSKGLERFPKDHPEYDRSRSSMAAYFRSRGKVADAEKIIRSVAQACGKSLGETHPRTLSAKRDLGIVLHEMAATQEAEEVFREVLQTRNARLGDDHMATTQSCNDLALLLKDLGQVAEAEELSRRAIRSGEKSLGKEHRHVVLYRHNLGLILGKKGQFKEAFSILNKVKEYRWFSREEKDLMQSNCDMAELLSARGHHDEALEHHTEAWAARELDKVNQQKIGHPWDLKYRHDRAVIRARMGDPDKALRFYVECATESWRHHGPTAFLTKRYCHTLAEFLKEQGEPRQADLVLEKLASETGVHLFNGLHLN
ncbi:METTL4 [Symbiodinium sp. CCMP2592]|nr:METTL4 [Symbiodinium sp. CCMP2592]